MRVRNSGRSENSIMFESVLIVELKISHDGVYR